MQKKYGYKIIFFTYQFFRQLRYSLLKSVFGIVIHCKHTPTCGTFFFRSIEKKGLLVGTVHGLKRVFTCW